MIYENKYKYKINIKMLQEESYFIDVHYDAMFDDVYFLSRYRFEKKEHVAKFVGQIETRYKNIIITSSIEYEKERDISEYVDNKPYRPRFSNLEKGLADLEQMINYCNNYLHANKSTYKYHSDISIKPIVEFEQMFLQNEKKLSKKESKEIQENKHKRHLVECIYKSNYTIQELNQIIEICQNKINKINELNK